MSFSFLKKICHLFICPPIFKDPKALLTDIKNKHNQPEEVKYFIDEVHSGLTEFEDYLVKGVMQKRGELLDVGCGAGREAIAFAKLGYKVKAIDISEAMIQAACGQAEKEGLDIEFEALSITNIEDKDRFDYCLFSSGVYNSIPTKELRRQTVRRIMRSLKSRGSLFIPIGIRRKRKLFARDTFIDALRILLKFFLKDRLKTDVGDALISGGIYHHFFSSFKDIENELLSSGFAVKGLKRGLWHLTKSIDPDLYPLNTGRNLILLNKSQQVIKEFNANGIDSIVLKGLYLAFNIYPDFGLRHMADVDILIKQEDFKKAEKILIDSGFSEVSTAAQRRYRYSAVFCDKDKIYIDIRWDACHAERFKNVINITQDFWNRAVEFSLDAVTAKTLSIEDHILYVSLHYGLIDLLEGTCGIWDLFYLIDNRRINWEKIITYARKYCVKAPVYYSLLKTSQITCLELPDCAIEGLKPNRFKKALIDYLLLRTNVMPLQYLCQALMMDDIFRTFRVLWRMLRQLLRKTNLMAHC